MNSYYQHTVGIKINGIKKNTMLWQWRFLYKLPASFMFLSVVPESSVRTGWRGGQEPLPLKVAPNQPSVTPAFHLQSRRDSDCQMWEIALQSSCRWFGSNWHQNICNNHTGPLPSVTSDSGGKKPYQVFFVKLQIGMWFKSVSSFEFEDFHCVRKTTFLQNNSRVS